MKTASQVALMVKTLPANAADIRDPGLIPGSRRSPGGGYGNLFQYSCLENPMDRGVWWTTVHWVAKSWTQLKPLSMQHRWWQNINLYHTKSKSYVIRCKQQCDTISHWIHSKGLYWVINVCFKSQALLESGPV